MDEPLTPQEYRVLVGIASGASNEDIAAELGIAATTVKTHVNHIRAKLGAKNRTQAAVIAILRNLVDPPPDLAGQR